MIFVGNQTAFSASSLTEPFHYAVDRGFDAFEWFPDKKADGSGWDDQDLPPASRALVRQTAEARGIRLSVHAHWTMNPLLPQCAPLLIREINLAEDLGAGIVVVHLYPEQGVSAYAKAILQFLPMAASKGLRLAIENSVHTSPHDFTRFFAELRRLVAEPQRHLLGSVGMCFDMGHANLCAATHNDYLRFMDQLDPIIPIIHLHLHENRGDADSHLTLFTGPSAQNDAGISGLIRRLKQRGFSGSAILEQWPQPPSLLSQARERLLNMWEKEQTTAAATETESPGPTPKRETRSLKPEKKAKSQSSMSARPHLGPGAISTRS